VEAQVHKSTLLRADHEPCCGLFAAEREREREAFRSRRVDFGSMVIGGEHSGKSENNPSVMLGRLLQASWPAETWACGARNR